MTQVKSDLTVGRVPRVLLRFSLPYMISCFLQTFYGLADLFIIGRFEGAGSITGVAVGSQVMHMVILVIAGLAMGPAVLIGRAVGAGDRRAVQRDIGASITLFAVFAAALTALMLATIEQVLDILSAPPEAIDETRRYLFITYLGIPLTVAFNLLSAVFRGIGDSRNPMWFVAAAGVINIALDALLIGAFGMAAAGAAAATVAAQAVSVGAALYVLKSSRAAVLPEKRDLRPSRATIEPVLRIGVPLSVQELIIQVSFIVITIIANRRGVDVAAAVGIVEKVISFLFLVPSAMLSSVTAVASQNAGAGLHARGREALAWGCGITFASGLAFAAVCEVMAEDILRAFASGEPNVVVMGAQYLRTYVLDCAIAGVHFCFSGYFCAYQMSIVPFAHNIASAILVRIPGSYIASVLFTEQLWQMGLAAPAGSVLSVFICAAVYARSRSTRFA